MNRIVLAQKDYKAPLLNCVFIFSLFIFKAPELILIQPYTTAVDIWSLGCILAELLSMQEGSVPCYQDRMPLFPGGSCFPLSADVTANGRDERLDQLSVILNVIGTPCEEDVSSIGKVCRDVMCFFPLRAIRTLFFVVTAFRLFLSFLQAKEYIRSLKKYECTPFRSIYPAGDEAVLDLLGRMLHFNPEKRCSAKEALEHTFFDSIRQPELEEMSTEPIVLGLEATMLDLDTLKRCTYDEVLHYAKLS